jgi:hypothetical protein
VVAAANFGETFVADFGYLSKEVVAFGGERLIVGIAVVIDRVEAETEAAVLGVDLDIEAPSLVVAAVAVPGPGKGVCVAVF